MQLHVKYSLLDGQGAEVTVRPLAVSIWERTNKTKVSSMADGLSMTDLCALALEQVRIDKAPGHDLSLDEFLAALDDLDPVEPTNPNQPVVAASADN
jgi:hypothetical protein